MGKFYFYVGVWAFKHLFPIVDVKLDGEEVKAIHFAVSEPALYESVRELNQPACPKS